MRVLVVICVLCTLISRDGNIRYADFLREIEEGADDDDTFFRESPTRGAPFPRGRGSGGGTTSTSERGRLEAALTRAIDRGIDYRREMELEEEGGAAASFGGTKEGVVSRQRRAVNRGVMVY